MSHSGGFLWRLELRCGTVVSGCVLVGWLSPSGCGVLPPSEAAGDVGSSCYGIFSMDELGSWLASVGGISA